MPALPRTMPPVGKSGPLMIFINSFDSIFGFLMSSMAASQTSERLCGGMLVAMPTAMPEEPLTRRFGTFAGMTEGSVVVPSKFGVKSTVSWSMSDMTSSAILARRASV